MATRILFRPLLPEVSPRDHSGLSHALRPLALLIGLLLTCISARAQFQQPFVFAADPNGPSPAILVFTRNDITGVLTPVPGSPFPSREPVNRLALDFKGRFLFVGTSKNNIEMFTVDPNTGALQEVPHSPFAAPTTKPVFLSTESTGQFLYVVDSVGSQPNVSAVESFQIDPVNLDLIPTAAGATDLPGLFTGAATHPTGKAFYVFCNLPDVANPNPNTPFFVLFNSSNGTFTTPSILPLGSTNAGTLALDPQGLHVAVSAEGVVTSQDLQSDGTLGSSSVSINLIGSPEFMTFDTLGQFLYVNLVDVAVNTLRFYSAASLQELPGSPLTASFPSVSSWIPDPTAPLIYADNVYQVDPQTGLLNSILSPDPLPPPFFQSTVFSRPPGSQPIVGPTALLSAMSLSFGSLSLGQMSSAQTLTILSNGGQALSLNTLAITGANPGDFAITSDTCHVPVALQPGQSCSVLISFTPSVAGTRTAALTITDNASPSMESAQLNGTGLNPAPAVTLMPGTLDFGTVTQGTSTPLNISLKNAGTAALHISSIAVGGADANDFSSSSPTCNSAIAANSACTITVTFTPLAPGVRSTTITITDDAPDSPQTVQVKGNANPAFTPGPAPNGSTTASVSAGQTAQYQLQLTPGAGYTGTVSLACSRAPLGATCQVPATVAIANGAPAPFTVTVSTRGVAVLPPSMPWRFAPPARIRVLLLLVFALLLVTIARNHRMSDGNRGAWRSALGDLFTAILLCSTIYATGCGSGSAVTPPPPIVTPSGTSTIIITMSAMSPTQQPLQLQPIQLTLTVK